MKIFRDGLEEEIEGDVKVTFTRDGHTVEMYFSNGKKRFFVTLKGTHWCAHGSTIAEAISDAIWKDQKQRLSFEMLKEEIKESGIERLITLNEFKTLTGACREGCKIALERAKLDGSPMTSVDIKNKLSKEWGEKLISILGFDL